MHLFQDAKESAELDKQQRELDDGDVEVVPSKTARTPKERPPPLKTQQSRQAVSKRMPDLPTKPTHEEIMDLVRVNLPPLASSTSRLPFAPLQNCKSMIKQSMNLPTDPLVAYNLCMVRIYNENFFIYVNFQAMIKFQLFGTYFRYIDKDGELLRLEASEFFNWDSVSFYYNTFLNASGPYM